MAGCSWGLRPEDHDELERRVTAEVDRWERRYLDKHKGEPLTPDERRKMADDMRSGMLRSLKAELREQRQRIPCGAKTRAGHPCRAKSVPGKRRCRMHGGLSTGPQTAEGMARCIAGRRA